VINAKKFFFVYFKNKAGLVAITGDADRMAPWASVVFGFIGCLIYLQISHIWVSLKIDDPLGASPLHGFVGLFGCILVGLTDFESGAFYGYGPK
jgi:Amt family ammonium transporter